MSPVAERLALGLEHRRPHLGNPRYQRHGAIHLGADERLGDITVSVEGPRRDIDPTGPGRSATGAREQRPGHRPGCPDRRRRSRSPAPRRGRTEPAVQAQVAQRLGQHAPDRRLAHGGRTVDGDNGTPRGGSAHECLPLRDATRAVYGPPTQPPVHRASRSITALRCACGSIPCPRAVHSVLCETTRPHLPLVPGGPAGRGPCGPGCRDRGVAGDRARPRGRGQHRRRPLSSPSHRSARRRRMGPRRGDVAVGRARTGARRPIRGAHPAGLLPGHPDRPCRNQRHADPSAHRPWVPAAGRRRHREARRTACRATSSATVEAGRSRASPALCRRAPACRCMSRPAAAASPSA